MEFSSLGSEKVYKGRAFDVERVHMQLPDGKQKYYDLVQHNDSVTIVPVDDQGNLLFVSQFRLGAGVTLLELPAGVMKDKEDPAVCADREVREETGMGAHKLELLGDFFLAPGYSTEHMYVFLASDLYANALDQDTDEFLQLESISIADAFEMAQNCQINDAKTIAALLLAKPKLMQWIDVQS